MARLGREKNLSEKLRKNGSQCTGTSRTIYEMHCTTVLYNEQMHACMLTRFHYQVHISSLH